MNTEYWLITAPAEQTQEQTWSRLDQKTRRENDLSTNFRFKIPDLRVGTADQLQSLADDLVKMDSTTEGVFKKIDRTLVELTGSTNAPPVEGKPVEAYITNFVWNDSKFPVTRSLRELSERALAEVVNLDEMLKKKAADFSSIRSQLAALQRREEGNLTARDLTPFVREEHVVETQSLTTLFVAVPRALYKEWFSQYESIKCKVAGAEGEQEVAVVVPRSSQGPLHEDRDYGLFTMVVFKRFLDDVKRWALERKFTVREFRFDKDAAARNMAAREALQSEEKTRKAQFVVWLQSAFAEVFVRWMHLKAIRAFAESVLRYGLPPDFMAAILVPKPGAQKRLRAELNKLYSHLAGAKLASTEEEDAAAASLAGAGQSEFYPYVYLNITPRNAGPA